MHRLISLAMLAMTPVCQADLGSLFSRQNSNECCPCPAPGQQMNGRETVTVLQPHTVYISQAQDAPQPTVTVAAKPATVFVTQAGSAPSNAPSGSNPVVVTVVPQPAPIRQPEPQTVTVVNGIVQQAQAQQAQQPQTVTVVNGGQAALPAALAPEADPKTAAAAGPAATQLISVVPLPQSTPTLEVPSVVTVTADQAQGEAPVNALPTPGSNAAGADPESAQTLIISEQPSPAAQAAAVTAAPEVQTVIQNVDHYTTLTKTAGGTGGDNIEIIIINIYTGESSCRKKHSGKPCHGSSHQYVPSGTAGASSFPCPAANVTTSLATAYNTIFVTLGPANGTQTAQPAPSKVTMAAAMGNVPRSPFSLRKW